MTSTADSFVKQITNLATSFQTSCAAAALFYWDDNNNYGLRIEATAIMKEFINNVDFGRDPEGILFYNAASDFKFDDDDKVPYNIYYNSESPRAIRIDFLSPDDNTCFSSFLTKDTNSVDTKILKDGSGKWRDHKLGTGFATLHKISTDSTVTLKMLPIGKKATFSVTDNSGKHSIDISGVFHFHNLTDLTGSSVTNYDSDRLLFYPDSDKSTLTGVFFPTDAIPIDNHADTKPPTATWKDL